jgi:hypothetical protein
MCLAHVADSSLSSALEKLVIEGVCRLCGDEKSKDSVVPLEALMAEVMSAVHFLYESPANAGVPWDGGWQGAAVVETWDVLAEVYAGVFDDEIAGQLEEILVEAAIEAEWTDNRHGSSLDAARWAWEQFVSDVMSESRFVFWPDESLETHSSPGQRSAGFLRSLLPYVQKSELSLLTNVPIGTPFFRGRLVEDRFSVLRAAKDLGPAPAKNAAANRMSPEGIPMFYGSATAETAIREIAAHGTREYASIGGFRNQRELTVLDLTTLPEMPSIFDRRERDGHGVVRFFRDFAKNVAAPIRLDGRPHMHYLPTQIVTEFFRWMPRNKIDGIKLSSAQDNGDTYVLFFDSGDVKDEEPKLTEPRDEGSNRTAASFVVRPKTAAVLTLAPTDVQTYKILRHVEAVPL